MASEQKDRLVSKVFEVIANQAIPQEYGSSPAFDVLDQHKLHAGLEPVLDNLYRAGAEDALTELGKQFKQWLIDHHYEGWVTPEIATMQTTIRTKLGLDAGSGAGEGGKK